MMPWLESATIIGVVVLAVLIWIYFRLRSKDYVEQVLAKRRRGYATSGDPMSRP